MSHFLVARWHIWIFFFTSLYSDIFQVDAQMTVDWLRVCSVGAPKVFKIQESGSKYSLEMPETPFVSDWEPKECQFCAGWSLQLWRILEDKQGCGADVLCSRLPRSALAVLCQKNQQKFMLRCKQHSHVTVSSSSQKRRVLHDGEISREYCG